MKMVFFHGELDEKIGMEIQRDKKVEKLWVSQKPYMENVLEMFSMQHIKPISTPLANCFKLSSSLYTTIYDELEDMFQVLYASTVGSLMYEMVCSRLDLSHAIGLVSKYMDNQVKSIEIL